MLERTGPSDSSSPSLRELYHQQQLQLERIAAANDLVAASASAAMYTATANASAKKKPVAANSSPKRFALRFSKATPSATAPPSSHFRYIKAKDATVLTATPDASRPSLTSIARVTGSMPITPPAPTGALSAIDNSTPSSSPLSLDPSPSSPARDSLPVPAVPIAMANKPSPAREQSVFDWSPDNSPKHLRSYMNDFLGGGAAQSHAKAQVPRTRPATDPAMPRATGKGNMHPEATTEALNIVKHRNRKGSVSAYFHPDNLPTEFAATAREMEVVTRRNRRMSSVDTTAAGSDLERPPFCGGDVVKQGTHQVPRQPLASASSSSSQIPLPIFGQASLRELRKRSAMHKPDGLKLIVASKGAFTQETTALTPVPASPSNQVSTDTALRSPPSRALSPAVPARGGSLYLKKGSSSKSRSPLPSPIREGPNSLTLLGSQGPLQLPSIEKGILFSSLGQGAPLEETGKSDGLPRFSTFYDLSAEIMSSLGPVGAAGAPTGTIAFETRGRGQSVSTIASNYSANGILGRSRKNSIIALPDADFETRAFTTTNAEPVSSMTAGAIPRRSHQTLGRPRGGSILQRLKQEEACLSGRDRKGSVSSVYSAASAETEDLPEADEEEETDNGEAALCFLPSSAAASARNWRDSWQSAHPPHLAGRRLSVCPSPITDLAYKSVLLGSRRGSLYLSGPHDSLHTFEAPAQSGTSDSRSEETPRTNSSSSTSRSSSMRTASTVSTPPTPLSTLNAVPCAPAATPLRLKKPLAPTPPPLRLTGGMPARKDVD